MFISGKNKNPLWKGILLGMNSMDFINASIDIDERPIEEQAKELFDTSWNDTVKSMEKEMEKLGRGKKVMLNLQKPSLDFSIPFEQRVYRRMRNSFEKVNSILRQEIKEYEQRQENE